MTKQYLFARVTFILGLLMSSSFMSSEAIINFSNRESRIKINSGANDQFVVNTPITGWNGTLEVSDLGVTGSKVRGMNPRIGFAGGVLESGTSATLLTAQYDGSTSTGTIPGSYADRLNLQGTDRIRAESGTVLQKVRVSGANGTSNMIEGSPVFADSIEFIDYSATLTLALQSKLNQNLVFASTANSLTLGDNLSLADDVRIVNDGIIHFNKRTLNLPGKEGAAWTSNLIMDTAGDIVLNSRTSLAATWTFSGNATLVGNGNVLDLTNGQLWVLPGSTLTLVDVHLKGLKSPNSAPGSGSADGTQAQCKIVMGSPSSSIVMSNVTMSLDGNFAFTTGTIKYEGGDSIIFLGFSNTFSIDGTAANPNDASMIIDGVTLFYDPSTSTTPSADLFYPLSPVSAQANSPSIYVNGGLVRNSATPAQTGPYIFNTTISILNGPINITQNQTLVFNTTTTGTIALDGEGYVIQFPNKPYSGTGQLNYIDVLGSYTVTIKNVILRGFDPSYVSLPDGGSFQFGDNVTIEFEKEADMSTAPQSWIFTGNTAIITGPCFKLSTTNYIQYKNSLKFMGIRVFELTGGSIAQSLRAATPSTGSTGELIIDEAELVVTGTYFFGDNLQKLRVGCNSKISGVFANGDYSTAGVFLHDTTAGKIVIDDSAILSFEPYFTYKYQSTQDPYKLEMAAQSSRLIFNGCILDCSNTASGLELSNGTLVINDNVTVFSGATETNALVLTSTMPVAVMAGATFDISGVLAYR